MVWDSLLIDSECGNAGKPARRLHEHLRCWRSCSFRACYVSCHFTRFKIQVSPSTVYKNQRIRPFIQWKNSNLIWNLIQSFSNFSSEQYDTHRFERMSNIIKQFKLSCSKTQSQFQGMEVRNSRFTAYIDTFTGNTYIMVITTGPDSKIPTTLTQLNIEAARKHFEKFLPENS